MASSFKERFSFNGTIIGIAVGQIVALIAVPLFRYYVRLLYFVTGTSPQFSGIDLNTEYGLFLTGVSLGSLAGGYFAAKFSRQAQIMNALIAFALGLVAIPFASLDFGYIEQFGVVIVSFSGYVVGAASYLAFAKQAAGKIVK